MEAFNVTFYLKQVKEQKAREISNIQQGNLTMREFKQKFIQLEWFALGLCSTKRAWTNKFILALRCTLMDHVASQRPRILVKAITIACVSKEVLAEQYGPLNKKDKGKNNNGNSNSIGKSAPVQNN